jgi:hypothetical protein
MDGIMFDPCADAAGLPILGRFFLAGFLAGLSADFLDNREMVVRRLHIAGKRAGRER